MLQNTHTDSMRGFNILFLSDEGYELFILSARVLLSMVWEDSTEWYKHKKNVTSGCMTITTLNKDEFTPFL